MFGGGGGFTCSLSLPANIWNNMKNVLFELKSFVKQVFNNEAASRHARRRANFQIID